MRRPRFELYKDKAGEWRWRLKARNGRIIAESGEGYKTSRGVERAIYSMMCIRLVFSPVVWK